jgi:hypothetical protein
MAEDKFKSFADIIGAKKTVKPPAYPWQDLALRVIKELGIPGFKRAAVFKMCKEKTEQKILLAMNDTKELCQSGAKWKYFFKIIDQQ